MSASPAESDAAIADSGDAVVRVSGVTQRFGKGRSATTALDGVELEVGTSEFLCIVGASGCGKTTLLNLIAGLEQPTVGTVLVGGRVAVMFQQDGLFPWLTAGKNVELALKLAGVKRGERRAAAEDLLASVRLSEFIDRQPHELSGGMRQRVALARALAQNAEIVLMDEPFGALDAMTRDLMHDEFERICGERGLTVVFVTHNVREAVRLGDRVVLMSSRPGRVAAQFAVDIARPRRIDTPEVATLSANITDRLREEVRFHAHANSSDQTNRLAS